MNIFAQATRCARFALTMLLLASLGVGCASQSRWVTFRSTPRNPLAETLSLFSKEGPKPTPRTEQVLRRHNLAMPSGLVSQRESSKTLEKLIAMQERLPSREVQYSIAELAYIAGKRSEVRDKQRALSFYGTSLLYAYHFLFDESEGGASNPYDPQFRGATDLYNQSLEATLRIVQADGGLRPGRHRTVETVGTACSFDVVLYSSGWHEKDVDSLKFVSDYQLSGLRNHYHTYGLGVPMIAERRQHEEESGAEQFYPDKLNFPLTAFLRIDEGNSDVASPVPPGKAGEPAKKTMRFVLELHDPLDRQTLQVAGSQVPMETDLSTPLAYFLNQPDMRLEKVSTLGLLNPGKVESLQGLYMLEPFDAHKMPVVMVHGLWSSPVTWMEMFNDLRSDPTVREHYQFWFYLYPTGQPFWVSASQMRKDLAATRLAVDPGRQRPALDQTVLVGHSMGGLVSRLQSVDSGEQFWATMSDRPFSELKADGELRQELSDAFFFQPSPSISRVVTMGTPHRGSKLANDFTEWLGDSLISLPLKLVQRREKLLARNQGYFRPNAPLEIKTSLDSLNPRSPLLTTLRHAEPAPWVAYHNIIGRQPRSGLQRVFGSEGDGVVSIESARLDDLPSLRSQIVVEAEHMGVHRHPQAVLEVRRILLQQLAELERGPHLRSDVQVASSERSIDLPKEIATNPTPKVAKGIGR